MDFLSLCRDLRSVFPKPSNAESITQYLYNKTKNVDKEQVEDAFRSLTNHWKKKGWTLNKTYAIHLEEDEEALFHDKGITVIKTPDTLPSDRALLRLIPMGKEDEKVVWF